MPYKAGTEGRGRVWCLIKLVQMGGGGGAGIIAMFPHAGGSEDLVAVESSLWPEMHNLEALFESRAGMVVTENPR